MSPLSLLPLLLLSLLPSSLSNSPPLRATLINCGAKTTSIIDGKKWESDENYVLAGTPENVTTPGLVPVLKTVRSFPFSRGLRRKFCYVVPVYRWATYMVRTTYYYGGINGRYSPPVFDQIVDGTVWSVVNTTEDYASGMSSYYEGVFSAKGKTMSVCVAVNDHTDSDMFMSALELVILGDSVYNSTDFNKFGLALVARNNFGSAEGIVRHPDDPFDRIWAPFQVNGSAITKNRNVNVSGFWNLPPERVFETELMTRELSWPAVYLPNAMYYIALYFAEDHNSSAGGSRVFNVSINSVTYYQNLNVTPEGVVVFSTQWPLAGLTKISFSPASGSNSSPLINAGEVFEVLNLGGKTHTRDVIALERIKSYFKNPPEDWSGDPCMPHLYSWTGITCSEGRRIRVIALNLTSMGLSGSLSSSISDLTALGDILLGNNSLSGSIPDLSSLKHLKTLHLENNQLSGDIPSSIGALTSLHELFLQNNNLTGQVPSSLVGKPGLSLKVDPHNNPGPPSP